MKVKATIEGRELKQLIADRLSEKLGKTVRVEDVNIQSREPQRGATEYRAEFEYDV